ncbi:hypothetical protein PBY51_010026 [Eleginops maclovinus]|nr:hypothetical protein PBY51_010026 [Eleginops maclovinus]
MSPPTCGDVALCGHRTASKSQAGETRRAGRILKAAASLSSSANTTALDTQAQSASSMTCILLSPRRM